MENQNLVTLEYVNYWLTFGWVLFMKKSQREIYAASFADYVIDALRRTGIKQAEIARRSQVSPQMISKLARKEPHSLTGKLLLPERETVDRIAKAFGDPPSKARRAAGYTDGDQVETIEEALDATGYWDLKGLSEEDRERLRPTLEILEREIERLGQEPRQPLKIVDVRKRGDAGNDAERADPRRQRN